MALQPMYKAQNDSVPTTLTELLTATATTIAVTDASVFPDPPGIAAIGGETTELVIYNGKTDAALTGVQRGVNGTLARIWPADTLIARPYTSYDHDTFITNIKDLDSRKLDKTGDGSGVTAAFTMAATRENITTGSSLATLFGRIAKWFADFKAGAFAEFGTANNQIARGDHAHSQYLTAETDPTVSAWAKAASKPTYTAAEVGAVPTSRTVNGKALSTNVTLAAADVGLGNVNNTSDMDKPISTATQNALNQKADANHSHTAGDVGAVELVDGKARADQISAPIVVVENPRQCRGYEKALAIRKPPSSLY